MRETALLVNAANLMSFAILWVVKFVIYNKLFHIDPVEYEEHHAEKVAASSHDAADPSDDDNDRSSSTPV